MMKKSTSSSIGSSFSLLHHSMVLLHCVTMSCMMMVTNNCCCVAQQQQQTTSNITNAVSKYVIMVGVDGMGQLYIENYTQFLPNLSYLIDNGSIQNRTRTRLPTISAPNWGTILTGMEPEKSGIHSNSWDPTWTNPGSPGQDGIPPATGRGQIPTPIWSIIKQQMPTMTTAVFYSWSWIQNLVNNDVDYHLDGKGNDGVVMETAIQHVLNNNMTNFMFLHLDQVDHDGHSSYWGSEMYYNGISNIDTFLGRLIQALQDKGYWDETTLFVTADHGGWRSGHVNFNQACMYVPNIWCSGGSNKIKKGYNSDIYTTNIDFVPTALHALGLSPTKFTSGRVMLEIFDDHEVISDDDQKIPPPPPTLPPTNPPQKPPTQPPSGLTINNNENIFDEENEEVVVITPKISNGFASSAKNGNHHSAMWFGISLTFPCLFQLIAFY